MVVLALRSLTAPRPQEVQEGVPEPETEVVCGETINKAEKRQHYCEGIREANPLASLSSLPLTSYSAHSWQA
jgi:hypothetical protein